jgi:hypothetical protein
MKQSKVTKEQGALDMDQLLGEFEGPKKLYELRALLKTQFLSNQDFIKRNGLTFQFSLFQIPALYLDFFFRKKVNSLSQFILEVPASKMQFPKKKLEQFDKTDVSMPLFQFQQAYSAFCSKNGYTEVEQIETQGKEVLTSFGISIEKNEGKLQPAYINFRFKSLKEKAEADLVEGLETKSVVNQFLL